MSSSGLIPKLRWMLPLAAILLFGGFIVIWWAENSQGELPVLGDIPQFTMTDQNGGTFGRADLDGKITIVNFMFTACPSVCPIMSKNIAEMYHDFAGSDKVQFVSITVDPSRDSLPVLTAYAESWNVNDNRWVFLWAPIDSVVWLSETGFLLGADNLPDGHTFRLTLLDDKGRIRGYYDGLDENAIARLRQDIRVLAREMS